MIKLKRLIKLDEYSKVIPLPRLVLMTRTFEKIGIIPKYDNWHVSINANDLDEISFDVHKYNDGVLNPIWDELIDLKVVAVGDENDCGKYEIQVTYTDEEKTIKSITGVSLENELGQLYLHDFHVNDEHSTEYDIDDQGNFTPTVLYDPSRPEYSLLNRVLKDKAPHWAINNSKCAVYVKATDDGIVELATEFQRTYTVDGTSIYDFLTGEVAKEANIVFVFDSDRRELWFKSLIDTGRPADLIGEDTTILVSKKKLGKEITINSNKDEVKNCFRVEGGDDLITSQVAVVNMTGDNYIYHFADFQLADMPSDLSDAIVSYNTYLDNHRDEYYGTNGLYTRLMNAYTQKSYLEHEKAPAVSPDPEYGSAAAQWNALATQFTTTKVGVSSLNIYSGNSFVGITNNVLAMANIFTDTRYKLEVLKSPTPTYDASTHVWEGVIRVTRVSDSTDFYPPEANPYKIRVLVEEDSVENGLIYTKQKVQLALAKGEMSRVDADFSALTPEQQATYFSQWNSTKLQSFVDGFNSCMSVLMSGNEKLVFNAQGNPETDMSKTTPEFKIATELYAEYNRRYKLALEALDAIKAQIEPYDDEINELIGYEEKDEYGNLVRDHKGLIQTFQESMSFYYYLSTIHPTTYDELYKQYRSYIREDTYQNPNRISDTLETTEALVEEAQKLVDDASYELKKACVLQRTMSVNLNNLLALPEFKVFYDGDNDSFELFNYIRVRTDDEILKLRLIGVEYSGDDMSSIGVTFSDQIESVDGSLSDLESILNQAKSIATSYNSTVKQAKSGVAARNYVQETIDYGLNAASTMLKSSDDNEVTISESGIIAKRMDDQGFYGDKQLRIIGNGMYMTTNAWKSVEMAVGEILFVDPRYPESDPVWKYGVIADALVGNLIVGQNMYIGNENGSVEITGSGIVLDGGTITWKDNHTLPQSSITGLVEELTELDDRIETFSQTTDPSIEWTTTELKDKHLSDLWFNPTDGLTKRWKKVGNVYSWETVTDSELEALAQSKATVFLTKPTSYRAKDLWILENNTVHSPNKKGSILVANTTSSSYVASHWTEDVRYTDDTTANQALEDARQGIADAAAALSRANAVDVAAQGYANTAETNAENYADTKDTALSATLTTAYQNYTNSKVGNMDHAVADYLNLAGATSIFTSEYAISPYIGGGYLNISKGSGRVIIDPSNQAGTGYIFAGMKTSGTDQGIKFGIDSNGNAVFTGGITATSLTLSTGVNVPASKVSGLATVATSGNVSDLNGISDYAQKTDLPPTVSVTHSTDANGVTTTNINVDGTAYTTYSASTNDGCMVYGFAKGSQSSSHSTNYFKVSKQGLLEADNAVIHGKIWASEGEFAGKVKTNSGSQVAVLDSGVLQFYKTSELNSNNTIFIGTTTQNSHYGGLIGSGYGSEFLYIGNQDSDSGSYTYGIWFNFGHVPDANYTSTLNILYSTKFLGTVDFTNTVNFLSTGINIGNYYLKYVDYGSGQVTLGTNAVLQGRGGLVVGELVSGTWGVYGAIINTATYVNSSVTATGGFIGNASSATTAATATTSTYNIYLSHFTGGNVDYATYITDNANLIPNNSVMGLGSTNNPWLHCKTASDIRLKKNIMDIGEPYEEMFTKLRPVSYKFRQGDNHTHIGFISQEVEDAMKDSGISNNIRSLGFGGLSKELKTSVENQIDDGDIDINCYDKDDYAYALDYMEFIALNTHMIQKLYKVMDEQQKEIDYLKSQLSK